MPDADSLCWSQSGSYRLQFLLLDGITSTHSSYNFSRSLLWLVEEKTGTVLKVLSSKEFKKGSRCHSDAAITKGALYHQKARHCSEGGSGEGRGRGEVGQRAERQADMP